MSDRKNIDAAVDALAGAVPSGHLLAGMAGGADLLSEAARLLDERLRERDEAIEKNTELGKMYLDAVSASQGHELAAAMLEAQRDAARAQVAALQDALRKIPKRMEDIAFYDPEIDRIAREALAPEEE